MEPESNSMVCRAGCGFYGSPATDGLCSVCYKAALKKKGAPPSNTTSSSSFSPQASAMDASVNSIPAISPLTPPEPTDEGADCCSAGLENKADVKVTGNIPDEKNDKKKHRCAVCRRKVGLTGFECRCGGLFCGVHRYSDKHDCSFDYRELGAQEIRRNNPTVVREKIKKI